MRVKKGLELRDVCGEKVIIPQGIENLDFSKMINLNESAAFLWEKVCNEDFSEEQLTVALCEEYDVDTQTAQQDVHALVEEWKKLGILEA